MRPCHIEQIPGESIFLVDLHVHDLSFNSARAFEHILAYALDAQREPVFLINVVSPDDTFKLDILLDGLQRIGRQTHIYGHPKIKEVILVMPDMVLNMPYYQDVFGTLIFANLEEALDYARSRIT